MRGGGYIDSGKTDGSADPWALIGLIYGNTSITRVEQGRYGKSTFRAGIGDFDASRRPESPTTLVPGRERPALRAVFTGKNRCVTYGSYIQVWLIQDVLATTTTRMEVSSHAIILNHHSLPNILSQIKSELLKAKFLRSLTFRIRLVSPIPVPVLSTGV